MKVVSPKQMQSIEALAYRDGASEMDFMEEAGSGVALVVHDYVEANELDKNVIVLCGKGNNAGDAYIAAVHLLHLEYIVKVYQLFPIESCSLLCQHNHQLFLNEGGAVIDEHHRDTSFASSGVILDGIFGTGFHGEIHEPVRSMILKANTSRLPIIAIDIPSGLNGETGMAAETTIVAAKTAFLGLPKTGFFINDGWNHTGKLEYVDFGLGREYKNTAEADMIMLFPDFIAPLMPKIIPSRHKYEAGYVIGVAGSTQYPGASLLSSWTSLKAGAGIVRLLHPPEMDALLAPSPYELIKEPYDLKHPEKIVETINKASAVFLGPGLDLNEDTNKTILKILPQILVPCVLDASVLTFLSETDVKLPEKTILTPHRGEMLRLLHQKPQPLNLDFLQVCQKYAASKKVTLILKGGPTFIFSPGEPIMVNPRGDPGMATAGSGDVLTGLLAALLAQGLSPKNAALLGTYLHGVAGEFASEDLTPYCMTASDIITMLPDAFDPKNW